MQRRVVLHLQGRIVAEWAELLEDECLQLIRSGLSVALDLSGVVFVGHSGIQTLCRVCGAGVEIIECPPLIAEVLEQEGFKVGRNLGNNHEPR